jgi:quercetin dioxygenase-like cupin family protein
MTDAHEPLPAGIANAAGPPSAGASGEAVRRDRSAEGGTESSPAAGRVIVNPISRERIVIREGGAQTGGDVLSFDLFLPPGAHVPARHVHPLQEEQFTVITGQMRFRLGRFGRRTILAQAGDTVRVPTGMAHWFGNAGAGVAHARVEARPALRMEEMFAAAAAMRPVRYVPGTRMPRPSELALFLLEFQRELAVPEVPRRLVRAVLVPLAWLGRRRGRAPRLGSTR